MTKGIIFTLNDINKIVVDYAVDKGLITTSVANIRWLFDNLDHNNTTLTISEDKS